MTTYQPPTYYLPSPVASLDGEWVTPSQVLARYLRDGYPRRDSVFAVRQIETHPGVWRWVIVGRQSGYVVAETDANPVDPNHDLYLVVSGGSWYSLHYSIQDGWSVDFAEVYGMTETFDDEGYPRLCDRDHAHTPAEQAEIDAYLDALDPETETDPDTIPLPPESLDFADYYAWGDQLCASHFDAEYPAAYFTNQTNRRGRLDLADYLTEIETHAVETGMGTTTQTAEDIAGRSLSRADSLSWMMATGRLATVSENQARQDSLRFLDAVVEEYQAKRLDRETAEGLGVDPEYLNIVDARQEIREDK